jgi:hypothetical protein
MSADRTGSVRHVASVDRDRTSESNLQHDRFSTTPGFVHSLAS